MLQQKRIAVVIPAYCEERLIGRTITSLPDFVDAIYVVDDGSPDATSRAAKGAGDVRLRLVRHERNQGVGAAIVSGYRAAFAEQADVVAVMAGDAQMDPSDLPAVLAPVVAGSADYVKGNRFNSRERRNMPWLRRAAGQVLSLATRLASGLDVNDCQCGFTAMSRHALAALPLAELWPGYGYPNDLLLLAARHGLRVAEVTVRPVYADEQSGVRPWHALLILGLIVRRLLRGVGAEQGLFLPESQAVASASTRHERTGRSI